MISNKRQSGGVPCRNSLSFTLIELLIVVAIIAILAGMLLPALNKARLSARSIACAANMKTAGTAIALYRDTYENYAIPMHSTSTYTGDFKNKLWMQLLGKLNLGYPEKLIEGISRMAKYMCPVVPYEKFSNTSQAYNHYAFNPALGIGMDASTAWSKIIKFNKVPSPSQAMYFAETSNNPNNDPEEFTHAYNIGTKDPVSTIAKQAWFDAIRHGKCNVLYWDGHVGSFTRTELPGLVYTKKKEFWYGGKQ